MRIMAFMLMFVLGIANLVRKWHCVYLYLSMGIDKQLDNQTQTPSRRGLWRTVQPKAVQVTCLLGVHRRRLLRLAWSLHRSVHMPSLFLENF